MSGLSRRSFLCRTTASGLLIPPATIINQLQERFTVEPDVVIESRIPRIPKRELALDRFLVAIQTHNGIGSFSVEGPIGYLEAETRNRMDPIEITTVQDRYPRFIPGTFDREMILRIKLGGPCVYTEGLE